MNQNYEKKISGGVGGKYFEDDLTDVLNIKSITIYWDRWVDNLSVTYELNEKKSRTVSYGGPTEGKQNKTIYLADDEYVTEISGHYGNWIDFLTIKTSNFRVVSGGGTARITPFILTAPNGKGFPPGFCGRSQDWLDAIGILVPKYKTVFSLSFDCGDYALVLESDVAFLADAKLRGLAWNRNPHFYMGTGRRLIVDENGYQGEFTFSTESSSAGTTRCSGWLQVPGHGDKLIVRNIPDRLP